MRRLPAVKGCIVIDYIGKVAFKGKGAMMRVQAEETSSSVIAFGPKKAPTDATIVADDAGRGIVALVQKAADLAKADCNRAMDLAHRLSSELRTVQERAREFEAQANYFRDRAAHSEEWLVRIRHEIQETFFDPKEPQQRHPTAS